MIVYDAGALVAADRGDQRFAALHRAALRAGVSPVVPASVLAQVWRGGPQPSLSRVLAGCEVMPLDERHARVTGALCGLAGTSDVVDGSVIAAVALKGATAVVTSDPSGLRTLAASAAVDVAIVTV